MAEGGEWPMEKLINAIITLLVQSLSYLIKKIIDRQFDGGKTKRGN